jgi:two-component system, NtrC family, nitrogen regulation response regulator GlnG
MFAEPQLPPTQSAPVMIRIVLAEDDGALRAVLARVLRMAGYEVIETTDGHALLNHLATCAPLGPLPPPALVVSDVRMPGPDGLRVMQQAHTWGQSAPFVLMTAFGSDDFHTAATECGATAVLEKPFALEELLTTVTSALSAPARPPTDENPARQLC